MSHGYRLHTGGSQTLDGWDTSRQYGTNEINNIQDPSGAIASLPITSVPTPFASLELARNAFEVCGAVSHGVNNVKGTTIYHKIVSSCLDTLEIFFNFNKLNAYVDIIPWNANNEITGLLNSENPSHQRLGQTLQLYINQDRAAFNFGTSMVFYLLNYKNGTAPLNIIGGTSTTSLTVASTNDLSYVDIPLSGSHNAYDSDPMSFRALIERDREFIKYVWTLSLQNNFSNVYPEVYSYILECFKSITDMQFKNELRTITPQCLQNYQPITVGAANIILPGGIMLCTYNAPQANTVSDFTIKSDYTDTNEALPLVLPNQNGYNVPGMRYVTGVWNPNVKAPNYDPRPMSQRTLPGDNSQCPYLTADDIFQPYIIKTAFRVDKKSYFLGHFDGSDEYSYLLPLKPEIFKYLSLDTLRGKTSGMNAQNIFELVGGINGGVEAIIRIPVQKGEYITLRRIYHAADGAMPDVVHNRGIVQTCTFDMYLYPSYHIANASESGVATPQRVYLLDGDWRELTKNFDYSVELYKAQSEFGANLVKNVVNRSDKSIIRLTSKIFVSDDEFDVIRVSNGVAEGMLLPNYKTVGNGGDSYEFAIDFGTTNTHVEYKVNGGNVIMPLEMAETDSAILSMHSDSDLDENLQKFIRLSYQEFVPTAFGRDSMAGFPIRTNICKARAEENGLRVKETLGDYGIGFHYEKYADNYNNRTITNLKWLGGTSQQYVNSFFEELMMLIRSKVLLNGGALGNTKITWFYPVSMEAFRFSQLRDEWNSICDTYIGKNCNVQSVTESLAPFYYYKNTMGVNAAFRPVVLMDIGGGTTDFAVYQKNIPVLISSVRFAGNSIYGDFPGFGMQMNGFFNKYKESYAQKISTTDISNLKRVFDAVVESGISADFVSFLYSLEKNSELRKRGISISFSGELKNDYSMKVVLLLFYVGEIYYLAHLFKEKGIGTPAYITISGTGSKVLDLIGGKRELEGLAKVIFNDIVGDDGKIELKNVANPKEITCKGGLCMKNDDIVGNSDELCCCFMASPSIEGKKNVKLADIGTSVTSEVINFYEGFVDYFFKLNGKFSFEKNFGVCNQRSFAEFRNILLDHAREDLAAVIDARKSERDDPDAELEDSLFFFPLAGGMNRLSYYISNNG